MSQTEEKLERIEENQKLVITTLTELKMAVCGSEKIGVEGLVKKVKKHEKYIESDKKRAWIITGGLTVLSFLAGLIISVWDKVIKS